MTKPRSPAPRKWRPTAAAKDASPTAVLRKTGQQLLRQIKINAAGVVAGRDPEYLHQLRVAVRRLRVLLPLTRGLFDERGRLQGTQVLKALAAILGPARDSDVFMADIWPPLRAMLGTGQLVETLEAEWLAQRRRNQSKLQRTLAARRFALLISRLEHYFASPGANDDHARGARHGKRFALKALRRRARRVRERYRNACDARHARHTQAARAQALHQLRIAVKKLRYELDFLAPLMRKQPTHKMTARLAGVQDILGTMNDVATAAAQVETALRRHRSAQAARLRLALHAWRAAQGKASQRKFAAAWKAWRQVNPFR